MAPSRSAPSPRTKLLAWFLALVVAPLLLFALVEAASSFVLLGLALRRGDHQWALLGQQHAQYDAELGWINTPSRFFPDMYGPRVPLEIDSQGFRVTRRAGARPPGPPKLRVVCSGDSFTFGYGVADERTWCARLAARHSGLATVNMGQPAYGVDQAYLWYKRDGVGLEHGVHLFTYITNDFLRMRSGSFSGFAKPLLAIRNDSLVVENTPVPSSETGARRYWTAVLVRNQLRLAQLLIWVRDSVLGGHGIHQGSLTGEWTEEDSLTWIKVQCLTADLSRLNQSKGSKLVLVHLPVFQDYWTRQSDPWRERTAAAAQEGEFVFLDLVRELAGSPPTRSRTCSSVGRFQVTSVAPGTTPWPETSG